MKVERSTLLLLFRLFRPIRCQGGNAHPHTGCWLGRGLIYVCHISFSRIPYLKKEAQYVVGEMPRLCTAQRSSLSRFSLAKSMPRLFVQNRTACACVRFLFVNFLLGQAFSYVDIVSHCHFRSSRPRFYSVIDRGIQPVNKPSFPPVHTPVPI